MTKKQAFDVVGDIHGCYQELRQLLTLLGYAQPKDSNGYRHPERTVVFVGDYVDRGPASDLVLDLVADTIENGWGLGISGNHDDKLRRKLLGRDVKIAHGLEKTLAQIEDRSQEWKDRVLKFLTDLPYYLVLNDGELVVAHAGIEERLIGKNNGEVKSFCLYGKTNGQFDELGLPIRLPWEEDYRGKAVIVYGHTPHAEVTAINNTYNIDTGCVFGGKLTCYQSDYQTFVSVPAQTVYDNPKRPL